MDIPIRIHILTLIHILTHIHIPVPAHIAGKRRQKPRFQ